MDEETDRQTDEDDDYCNYTNNSLPAADCTVYYYQPGEIGDNR